MTTSCSSELLQQIRQLVMCLVLAQLKEQVYNIHVHVHVHVVANTELWVQSNPELCMYIEDLFSSRTLVLWRHSQSS